MNMIKLMKRCAPLMVATLAGVAGGSFAAPANDNFASPATLLMGRAEAGSNVGATLEAGEPLPATFTPDNYQASVWWQWQPVISGWYELSTEGSSIDTVLSVWTSPVNDLSVAPTLVHVNDEAPEGRLSRIQFYADSRAFYKVGVAGHDADDQGSIRLKVLPIPDPFVRVVAVQFSQAELEVTNGAVNVLVTLTLEASREITSGRFTLRDPQGVEIARLPFSASNRINCFVAHGEYQVSVTVPRYVEDGSYQWSLEASNAAVHKNASLGGGALSPLTYGLVTAVKVRNEGVVDGYAQWVAKHTGGTLDGLLGGTESLEGDLSLDRFAFGLPASGVGVGPLELAGSSLMRPGKPVISTENGVGGKRLRVKYSRRVNSAQQGVYYQVQFSGDLQTWEDAAQPEQSLATDGTYEAVAVDDAVTVSEASRRFARIVVSRAAR